MLFFRNAGEIVEDRFSIKFDTFFFRTFIDITQKSNEKLFLNHKKLIVNFQIDGGKNFIKKILDNYFKGAKKIEGEFSFLLRFQELLFEKKFSFLMYIEQIDDIEITQQIFRLNLFSKEKKFQNIPLKQQAIMVKGFENQMKKLFS